MIEDKIRELELMRFKISKWLHLKMYDGLDELERLTDMDIDVDMALIKLKSGTMTRNYVKNELDVLYSGFREHYRRYEKSSKSP